MFSVMEREAAWPVSGGKNMQTCKTHCLFDSCEEKSFCMKDKHSEHAHWVNSEALLLTCAYTLGDNCDI